MSVLQGEDGVAADTALTQVVEDGGGLGPVGDAADLGVQAAGGDQPDECGEVGSVGDVGVGVVEVAQRRRLRPVEEAEEVEGGGAAGGLPEPDEGAALGEPVERERQGGGPAGAQAHADGREDQGEGAVGVGDVGDDAGAEVGQPLAAPGDGGDLGSGGDGEFDQVV